MRQSRASPPKISFGSSLPFRIREGFHVILGDDVERDEVDRFKCLTRQLRLGALEALDRHVGEALSDGDRLRAGFDLVIARAATVDCNNINIRHAGVFECFDNARGTIVPMAEHALDLIAVLHDEVFHDRHGIGGDPTGAVLGIEQGDLAAVDDLTETVRALDLRVVTGLAADFNDGCAIREMIDKRLTASLASHGVVHAAEEITILLRFLREVRGEHADDDAGIFRFHQTRNDCVDVARVDEDGVVALRDAGADGFRFVLNVVLSFKHVHGEAVLRSILLQLLVGVCLRLVGERLRDERGFVGGGCRFGGGCFGGFRRRSFCCWWNCGSSSINRLYWSGITYIGGIWIAGTYRLDCRFCSLVEKNLEFKIAKVFITEFSQRRNDTYGLCS